MQRTEHPDHLEFVRQQVPVDRRAERIEALLRGEIIARGIRVPPGGVEHGLLDFPATLNGRWVYLCRKRGKPRVEPWHEITAGFAGRQPVTEDDEPRMGMERTDPWDAAP